MLRLAGENVVNVIARVLQHGENRRGGRVPILAPEMAQDT